MAPRPLFALAQEEAGEAVIQPLNLLETDTLEHQLLELHEHRTVGDELAEQVEEAGTTVDTLSAVQTALRAQRDEGQEMTEVEAQVLQQAMEHLCQRVGLAQRRRPAVAQEGFAHTPRQDRLALALEGVASFLQGIWDALVRAFRAVVDWIKGFFRKLFGTQSKLEKRAEEELKKAEEELKAADDTPDQSFNDFVDDLVKEFSKGADEFVAQMKRERDQAEAAEKARLAQEEKERVARAAREAKAAADRAEAAKKLAEEIEAAKKRDTDLARMLKEYNVEQEVLKLQELGRRARAEKGWKGKPQFTQLKSLTDKYWHALVVNGAFPTPKILVTRVQALLQQHKDWLPEMINDADVSLKSLGYLDKTHDEIVKDIASMGAYERTQAKKDPKALWGKLQEKLYSDGERWTRMLQIAERVPDIGVIRTFTKKDHLTLSARDAHLGHFRYSMQVLDADALDKSKGMPNFFRHLLELTKKLEFSVEEVPVKDQVDAQLLTLDERYALTKAITEGLQTSQKECDRLYNELAGKLDLLTRQLDKFGPKAASVPEELGDYRVLIHHLADALRRMIGFTQQVVGTVERHKVQSCAAVLMWCRESRMYRMGLRTQA